MKVRFGFVSNSSSEEYVCPVCTDIVYVSWGGDLCDLEEGELPVFAYCDHCGRVICRECVHKYLCEKEVKEVDRQISEHFRDGEDNPIFTNKDFCPLCSSRYIPDSEFADFVVKKFNLRREDIMKEMRESRKAKS